MNFPEPPALWEKLDIFQTIRNVMAHNDGLVNQDVDKVNNYICKAKSAPFKLRSSRIILKDTLIPEAINLVKECLGSLHGQVNKTILKEGLTP